MWGRVMSFVSDNRSGIRSEISGFVVHEDPSLDARLKRSYAAARESFGAMWAPAQPLPPGVPADTGCATALAATDTPAPVGTPGRTSPVSILDLAKAMTDAVDRAGAPLRSGLGKVSRWIAHRYLTRAYLLARLQDLGALTLATVQVSARLFWQLPHVVKLVVITLAGVGLAMTWPAEPSDVTGQGEDTHVTEVAVRGTQDPWRTLTAPIAAYHLEAPELDRSGYKYRARVHTDGARQDFMLWAPPSGETSPRKLRTSGAVSIEHYPKSAPAAETFYLDLTRRAALAGASVERLGAPIGLETKFGPVETSEATVLTEAGSRSCLAFRHIASAVPMQLHGWFCGTADRPVDRAALGCLIDRIDLVSAGNDTALRSYFGVVERARRPCGPARLIATKASWLDSENTPPPLKSSLPALGMRP